MLKIKKIMATALVFIMMLSLVAVPAMAEDAPAVDALKVVYFNADSSKIVIDFNKEVDAELLAGALTLTKDGEEIGFGVEYVAKTAANEGNLEVNPDYTYVVILDDGIALDEIYDITISAGLEAMDGGVLESDYAKMFAVEKLWKEDFDYADASALPWKLFSAISGAKTTVSDGILTANTSGGSSGFVTDWTSGLTFADTGMSAKDFYDTFKNERYFNTEISVKNVSVNAKSRVIISNQSTSSNLQPKYNNIIAGGIGKNNLIAGANIKDKTIESNGATGTQVYNYTGASSTHTVFDNTDFFTLSLMHGSDSSIKVFGDGLEAYGSYTYSSAAASTSNAYVGMGLVGGPTYSFDYILVTKVTAYEKGSYTMTPANGAADVEISDEIRLTFEKPVDPATLSTDAVEVYVNDDLTNNYTVSPDETDANSVIIKLDEPMSYRAQYKVLPKSVKFLGDATDYMFSSSSFETTAPEMEITELDINYVSGKYVVKATFQNNKIEDGIKGVMSVCLYDANGKMLDIEIQEIDVAMGADVTVTDSWDDYEEGEYYAKCYIWDGMVTMNTIISEIFE